MKKTITVILFIVLMLSVCYLTRTQKINLQRQSLKPKQVVENYFKYWDEKNSKGMLSCLTEKYDKHNIDWEFGNLKSVNLISIVEESNTGIEAIYKVEFELKNKKDEVSSMDSGKWTWTFVVIRNDKNSPWLIDNYGEG